MGNFSRATTISVDLSVDGGLKFSYSPQTMYVIDAPILVDLNNTQYFYTLNETVNIKVTGYYFTQSGFISARVDE